MLCVFPLLFFFQQNINEIIRVSYEKNNWKNLFSLLWSGSPHGTNIQFSKEKGLLEFAVFFIFFLGLVLFYVLSNKTLSIFFSFKILSSKNWKEKNITYFLKRHEFNTILLILNKSPFYLDYRTVVSDLKRNLKV